METNQTGGFENIREKFGRFRILIIGRANAGKTTILRAICNTTENPAVYDGEGNQIDLTKIEGSRGCGIHDIEHELIFQSNEKFVFHDSRGFEAGSTDEFERLKKFIADRANTTHLKKRIHAIWYCIPMDKLDRAIQRSEEMFFNGCDTRNVPVIVLFTKFDALLAVAMSKLSNDDQKLSKEKKVARAHELVDGIFENANIWGRLCQLNHAPKCSVLIGGMHNSNEACDILLENTAGALNEEALQISFVTAQETNIALCIKYAVRGLISDIDKLDQSALPIHSLDMIDPHHLGRWFPHFWIRPGYPKWPPANHKQFDDGYEKGERFEVDFMNLLKMIDNTVVYNETPNINDQQFSILKPNHIINHGTWKHILLTYIDILLILEHSFYLFHQKDSQPVLSAIQKYKASNIPKKVKSSMKGVFNQYGKAFKEEKIEMILNVVVQNRMSI